MDTGHHDVELRQHLVGVIECAVLEDVDLDTGEDAKGSHFLVEGGDIRQLLLETLLAQSVGDGQARRVIGQHHVLVTEVARGARHRLDRRAAVTPQAVEMAVAFQSGAVLRSVASQRHTCLGLDLVDVARVPVQRFGDESGSRIADPFQFCQGAGLGARRELFRRRGANDLEGADERLRLEPCLVRPVEAVNHAFERLDGCHVSECRWTSWRACGRQRRQCRSRQPTTMCRGRRSRRMPCRSSAARRRGPVAARVRQEWSALLAAEERSWEPSRRLPERSSSWCSGSCCSGSWWSPPPSSSWTSSMSRALWMSWMSSSRERSPWSPLSLSWCWVGHAHRCSQSWTTPAADRR